MKIKLPKRLRGFSYSRVMPVELNSFDVDILMPAVFFEVISEGKDRGRIVNNSEDIGGFVDKFAHHPDVEGFEGEAGRRTLDRLVRTALVQIGRKGQSGTRQQIMGLTGYTFLAFKPGFPAESSTLRRVPSLIYRMMRDQLRGDEPCRHFFEEVFGQGVVVRGGAQPDGWYDGHTELDTLTRLSLAFLDGFAATGVKKPKELLPPEPCPALADGMANDLRRYLQTYRDRMPIEALTYTLRALINVELFAYSLKLFNAVIELTEDPYTLPPAMGEVLGESRPELYADFTAVAGPSREMAAGCVRRDLETIQRFVAANLKLRQLDRYIRDLRTNRRVGQIISQTISSDQKGPKYLQELLRLLKHPEISREIDAAARVDEQAIREENTVSGHEEGEDIENPELDRLVEGAESDFEALVTLLVEAQRIRYTQSVVQWFYSVGGLTKPHGLLQGQVRNRQGWRYEPSNDLLAALIQLAAIQGPNWDWRDPTPRAVSLRVFLDWLEKRFGIIVDRPPAEFEGPEYAAAAQENLSAMLRRLRQMGIFRDLSDDFTVQRLSPPYADEALEAAR